VSIETNFADPTFGFRSPLGKHEVRGHLAEEVALGSLIGGIAGGSWMGLGILGVTPVNSAGAAIVGWVKDVPEEDLGPGLTGIGSAWARAAAGAVFAADQAGDGRRRTGLEWLPANSADGNRDLVVQVESLVIRFDPRVDSELSVNPKLRGEATASIAAFRPGGPALFGETVSIHRSRHSFAELARDDGRLAEAEIRGALCDLSAAILRRMHRA
jgi:hypothetical protein